jgi:hypothetical protein
MKLDIHAGKRVLYKDANGGGWQVGEIDLQPAIVNNKGVWFSIIPREFIGKPEEEIDYTHLAEINDIFLDAIPLEEWLKSYKEYFMTREEYIEFVQSENFEKAYENSYVSDGEYIYYPVSKYTKNWIEKQPFDYIVRGEQ